MRMIDLSHEIINFPYPGDFGLKIREEIDEYITSIICFSSHLSTHIDYPKHVHLKNKEYDIVKGVGYCIKLEDLDKLNNIDNNIDILLIYSGYSELWRKEEYFKKYPKIDVNKILELNIKCVGVDACSIGDFEEHYVLLSNNILIIENLNSNLKHLINEKFYFLGVPLKIKNVDASPIRCFAIKNFNYRF
ncbi:cyclase family protein [Methanocaldococcus indicus]|uniref:cyclase family protein n=1 Tax=Methanocaldococcus indicus TaxID=213231 RepID=UPI003C6D2E56